MNLKSMFVALLCGFPVGCAVAGAGRLAIENRKQEHALVQQQAHYRRTLEAFQDLSRLERQWLDRQSERQLFQQRLLQHRQLQQFSPGLDTSSGNLPAVQLDRFRREQELQLLHFKIERSSWHYLDGLR
jgi:hypothetical protein